MDNLSKERRSWNMSQVKSKDTIPEKMVRSSLHRMGFRFCLHRKDLPGKPDLVLPKHGTVVFVHGCFWHQHQGCRHTGIPKSNKSYWRPKLEANTRRDLEQTSSRRNKKENTMSFSCVLGLVACLSYPAEPEASKTLHGIFPNLLEK